MRRSGAFALAAILGAFSADSPAVQLAADGIGQALIYPYYTTRPVGTNPFNTYVTVVNTDETARALRVRFREGANGREVASFNLFLGPLDAWVAAIVPDGDGAKLVSPDNSCVVPAMQQVTPTMTELAFSSAAYSGANADGAGTGRDRTREGYVEILEMATVAPMSNTYWSTGANGTDPDCLYITSAMPQLIAGDMRSPTGGLMGTLTLINVASGEDFTVNAEALAELTTQHMYRPAADPYPDFDATEVTPRSTLVAGDKRYVLDWTRRVDAVSSVLMQMRTEGEFVADVASASRTDWVFTLPTRRFYRSAAVPVAPFAAEPAHPGCDPMRGTNFNRDTREWVRPSCEDLGCGPGPAPDLQLCTASSVWTAINGSSLAQKKVLASANDADSARLVPLQANFQNGWARMTAANSAAAGTGLVSLPGSRSIDVNTGVNTSGTFRVLGLPLVGFMARTFTHGALTCSSGVCQGSYGSAFPHKATRSVVGVP